ncbi:MAG: ATP-binding protein [Pseudomonadales bacterium]|nr:ATP-binding protein [Pseudomonadales bacterium]
MPKIKTEKTISSNPVDKLVKVGLRLLTRVEQHAPQNEIDWSVHLAAVWRSDLLGGSFKPHEDVAPIKLNDLLWIEQQKQILNQNTLQFVRGYPANNVLLSGARGTGKSSVIHALLNKYSAEKLRLVEVDKQALVGLPDIVDQLRALNYRFILFCDDMSFESDDASYKELKSVLEGSVFTSSDNILIYATSNRRHLLPEYMSDNQDTKVQDGELHPGEAIEEKVSLSDRFGVWVSFYPFRQEAYLDVVAHWLAHYGEQFDIAQELDTEVRQAALQWALARGVRNGRTANYFARHWVGQALLKR